MGKDRSGWIVLGLIVGALVLLNRQGGAGGSWGDDGTGGIYDSPSQGPRAQNFNPNATWSQNMLRNNQRRFQASVFNGSQGNLYLLLAPGQASLTNYTVRLQPSAHFEVPDGYKGEINGIWDVVGTGTAQVTES